MPMNKIQDVKLETTATYQPLSDLNVRFWNQDKNTAELRFIITRNQSPLSLSKENVKVIIALESGSSFISSDDFIIDSEVEGVARYIIPNDFIRVASNVTGQVYVTTLDGEEVIVERQFKFTVSNDLLNDYPSEDKLRYIKTFDDLRIEISSRVSKLESDMESMEDYVTQVQDTTQSGVKELNNLIKSNEEKLQSDYDSKINTINSKGQEYSTKFDEYKSDIDKKKSDFENSVNGSGLVTTGESKDWQKYKLTNDDGTRQYLKKGTIKDVKTLSPGSYETVSNDDAEAQDLPSGLNNTYIQIDVSRTSGDYERKRIELTSSYLGEIYYRIFHTNGERDTGWQKVAFIDKNNPYETTQGSQAKATTAENNARQYTDDKVKSINTVLFEGTANGVNTTINLNETLDNFVLLYVYVSSPAGIIPVIASPFGPNNMPIQISNVLDDDGNGGVIYECILSKVNRTQLKISNDVSYDLDSQTGSGANANKLTITKIVGVRNI